MTDNELSDYWEHTHDLYTPCLPEPADQVIEDWHESGNLE
jgi:hypothetical protein